tara:strand:+ start:368 stop:757 length:390 start_codon:yes stop_codon:yes gene_type:complete
MTPYLKGLKVTDNYSIVETNLRSTWNIPSKDGIDVKQKEGGSHGLVYNLFYSSTLSFDDMIEWLKVDVIDYNLEIEEKERLLKSKVEELKRVFETKGIDELNNLKFTTEDDLLSLGSLENNKKVETKED